MNGSVAANEELLAALAAGLAQRPGAEVAMCLNYLMQVSP
jgi:triosephosphate isomerase